MKSRSLLALLAVTLGAAVAPDASAHGVRPGFRASGPPIVHRSAPIVRVRPGPVVVHGFIGAPWGSPFGPWWYGWPYGTPSAYYGPPVVAVPATPPVYVEQGGEPSAVPVPGYWYWCAEPEGYHPDVPDCPGGWQAVPPRSEQRP